MNNYHAVDPDHRRPFLETSPLAAGLEESVPPRVPRIFRPCDPAHVTGFVVAEIVRTVQLIAGTRSPTDVLQERLIPRFSAPGVTNTNLKVVRVCREARKDITPGSIFGGPIRLSVSAFWRRLSIGALATSSARPGCQRRDKAFRFPATSTSTRPVLTFGARAGDRPVTECRSNWARQFCGHRRGI